MKKITCLMLGILGIVQFCSACTKQEPEQIKNVILSKNSSMTIQCVRLHCDDEKESEVHVETRLLKNGQSIPFSIPVYGDHTIRIEVYDTEGYKLANTSVRFNFGDSGKNILNLSLQQDKNEDLPIITP
jgi:hypothetical protein